MKRTQCSLRLSVSSAPISSECTSALFLRLRPAQFIRVASDCPWMLAAAVLILLGGENATATTLLA